MTKTPTIKESTYNLNLSRNYVPDWELTEMLREVISNAVDVDPMYDISNKYKKFIVLSNSISEPANFLTIGKTTKADDHKSIGQFGEGIKLAALVALRNGHSFQINSQDWEVTFFFKDNELGEETLHALVRTGLVYVSQTVVLIGDEDFRINATYKKLCNEEFFVLYSLSVTSNRYIYYKGVKVMWTPFDVPSFGFNIKSGLTITRDRNAFHEGHNEIAKQIVSELSPKQADTLLEQFKKPNIIVYSCDVDLFNHLIDKLNYTKLDFEEIKLIKAVIARNKTLGRELGEIVESNPISNTVEITKLEKILGLKIDIRQEIYSGTYRTYEFICNSDNEPIRITVYLPNNPNLPKDSSLLNAVLSKLPISYTTKIIRSLLETDWS